MEFLFRTPQGFIYICKPVSRYYLKISFNWIPLFYNRCSGKMVTLDEIRDKMPHLPSEERIALETFFKKHPTDSDLRLYWAKRILSTNQGRDKRRLAQEIIKEEGELIETV